MVGSSRELEGNGRSILPSSIYIADLEHCAFPVNGRSFAPGVNNIVHVGPSVAQLEGILH